MTSLRAQPVLSVDFNDRTGSGITMPGFDPFVIDAAQSAPVTRTFGSISLTLAGNGANYDDRERTTPTDGGAFTESLLLRDFVFANSTTTGTGLDVTIDGLVAGETYQVTIWSFDSGSTATPPRVSDWWANGVLVQDNYAFSGSVLPANNAQYQLNFQATATSEGRIVIQGLRDAATGGGPAVFINALRLETGPGAPPTVVASPADVTAYAGEIARFTVAVAGTAPFYYQWVKDDNELPGATNATLLLTNVQSSDAGNYSVIVSNAVGTAESAAAALVVLPVENIATRLLAYWQLDTLDELSPDTTTNQNHLTATNLVGTNLLAGNFGNALFFDGTSALLFREVTPGTGLPAVMHKAYSVALWVKGSFSNQLDRRVFAESANTNNTPLLTIGTHSQGSNGVVDIFIRNNNGSNPVNHRRSSLIAFDDTWHHIAWVDDAGYGRLYVDGQPDTNNFDYVRGELTPNFTTVGGILRSNTSHFFTGLIDDVAVWGRALSADEVLQVMASGPLPAGDTVLTGIRTDGPNLVIEFSTPAPMATHRVVESDAVTGSVWTPGSGVVLTGSAGNTFTATFPRPTGGQRFYRVARP